MVGHKCECSNNGIKYSNFTLIYDLLVASTLFIKFTFVDMCFIRTCFWSASLWLVQHRLRMSVQRLVAF